ncbi:hypothetical protein [Streptomyces sp. NPDC006355]|uniref:hypothetical protein n=1 Tax=Streptomyces sp. NPDC006355 TaxID=3156758 RepID=UPI0033B64552
MLRDWTPRFVVALAALLVALQFVGVKVPAAPGNVAYSSAVESAEWSADGLVVEGADESATCGDREQTAAATTRVGGRDRHRPAAKPSAGGVRVYECTAPSPAVITTSHPLSRSSSNPSIAALQVFRC